MRKIHYEARFICYHHNTGAGDNGIYTDIAKFKNEEEARHFIKFADRAICFGLTYEFAYQRLGIDGYIKQIDGLYRITTEEEKI